MSDLEKKKYIQNYSKIIDLLEESKEINLLWKVTKNSNLLKNE
jgi:hypothetical protein